MYAYCEICNWESDDYQTKKELKKAISCKKKELWQCRCPKCGNKGLSED